MDPQRNRLDSLRVADIMQQPVITLSVHSTMAEAARVLCEQDVSGAPVVDEWGRCIGVLSARDFTRRDQEQPCGEGMAARGEEFSLSQDEFRGPMQIHYVPEDSVERYMSASTQTIEANASLREAARYMTEGHVDRLIVVDDASQPVGVVSTHDLLRTWVQELS